MHKRWTLYYSGIWHSALGMGYMDMKYTHNRRRRCMIITGVIGSDFFPWPNGQTYGDFTSWLAWRGAKRNNL